MSWLFMCWLASVDAVNVVPAFEQYALDRIINVGHPAVVAVGSDWGDCNLQLRLCILTRHKKYNTTGLSGWADPIACPATSCGIS